MTVPPSVIQADFDRIALLETDVWNHNDAYHRFLLRHLPEPCGEALDIGCGTGTFARLLAGRCGHVLGVDLAPNMVRVARERSVGVSNVEFQVADVLACDLGEARYDCIASIATFHHLPLAEMLGRVRRALRPGGVLLVLDLWRAHSAGDYAVSALAVAANLARRARQPEAARATWARHGEHDRYPTMADVRRACVVALPGARVRRHVLWRYSIVWLK